MSGRWSQWVKWVKWVNWELIAVAAGLIVFWRAVARLAAALLP